MLQPVHTPLNADRITGLADHLGEAFAASLTLTTLAVRRFGGVEAFVIVHLGDGGREKLSASEARSLASRIRQAAGDTVRHEADWADSLDDAADSADRQASAMLLAHGTGRTCDEPRAFRGPR